LRGAIGKSAFIKLFQVSLEETENRLIYELGGGQWDIPVLRDPSRRDRSPEFGLQRLQWDTNFPSLDDG
jgi:hypothetical protein